MSARGFLFTSDWHWQHGQNGGVPMLVKTTDWLCSLIEQRKPVGYANLGDSSVAHGWIETDVLHAMVTSYGRIGETCRRIDCDDTLLDGNHDQSDREGKISLAPVFRGAHRRVVSDGAAYAVAGLEFGALAYCRDRDEFRRRAAALGKVDVQLVHQDIQGAMWRPGQPAEAWLDPHEIKARRVFGGHYHHPQIVAKDPLTVIVGSIAYASHHDALIDIPRGALWWDADTGAMEWVENPHTPIYHSVPVLAGSMDDRTRWEELTRLASDPRARRMRIRAKFADADAVVAAEKTFAGAFDKFTVGPEETAAVVASPVAASGFGWSKDQAGPLLADYVARCTPSTGIDRSTLVERGAKYLGLTVRAGGSA